MQNSNIRDFAYAELGKIILECNALVPDASNRSYYRIRTNDNHNYIIMDASRQKESMEPFIRIAEFLRQVPLSAPEILSYDLQQGLMILEDFGTYSFTTILKTEQDDKDKSFSISLYENAIDALIKLHEFGYPSDIGNHSEDILNQGITLFIEEFLVNKDLSSNLIEIFQELYKNLDMLPQTLILRDYHADNLMLLPNREKEMSVGILDFQDALVGSPAYDVVSLLQDARIDVAESLERAMMERYCKKRSFDIETFEAIYQILGAQRNMRILGRFSYLAKNGNVKYLNYIPRVLNYLRRNLMHPVLKNVIYLSRQF